MVDFLILYLETLTWLTVAEGAYAVHADDCVCLAKYNRLVFSDRPSIQGGPKIGTVFLRLNCIKYQPIFEIVLLSE